MITATVVLDIGNSQTRGIVLCGKDKGGKFREKSFVLSNRFSKVSEDYEPSTDYTSDNSTIFIADCEVAGEKVEGAYVNGEIQEREFEASTIRPSAIQKKYDNKTTALSYELAMLYAYKAVAELEGVKDINSLDIVWNVGILLPPGDMDKGKLKIVELVKNITKIEATFPSVEIKLNVKTVNVMPEGFCAYIATVYDRGSVIRKGARDLLNESTLIIDIGAGTTDIVVVRENKLIGTTLKTINRGGNQVMQKVRTSIETECDDLVLPETAVEQGIVDGFVKDGARKVDITEFINAARREVANQLTNDIRSYLERTEYPIRTIEKLLVCGGGAMGSDESKGIKSLSDLVLLYIRNVAPYVELIDLPIDTKTGEVISSRELNVRGASIIAAAMPQ